MKKKDAIPFQTARPAGQPDVIAPDGSEIRLLPALAGGSMVHCTLPEGATSLAVAHRTVEEPWYFTVGTGQVWRAREGLEETSEVSSGTALAIPLATHFQFRNTGSGPLEFVIVTLPPWPGTEEAYRVVDHWPVVGEGATG